jgi:hypothetical protein
MNKFEKKKNKGWLESSFGQNAIRPNKGGSATPIWLNDGFDHPLWPALLGKK